MTQLEMANSSTQDVAIIGLACRAAGDNDSPEKLWQFCRDKKNASGVVPEHRWEPWMRRDPRNAKILDNIIRKGYFLSNLEDFDAAFFGISPKEAVLMDPHQRLALELTWEAFENAGINPRSLAGSNTAVYMGVDSDDYSRMLMEDLPEIEAWSGIGTAAHGIPNRISYHLDLQGPSTAVDAACASSLIAIHLARQAIVSGESTVAICGGVNVICAPGLTHMLQKAGALSPEGVCRSFDDEACGYARGEGGATIVLKQLDAAITDGDNILAVLKGSASAQDGKTNGIMAPNAAAQEMVACQALQRAGNIDPRTIGFVEAHATSTALGDPTEISAIAKVYGVGRDKASPCYIGSIKPNVGHLEAAAGAIGFVKAVLSVQKGELAPQALLGRLNSRIDWQSSGLEVVRESQRWPINITEDSLPRRAAVCCYGYGGSVCHAIIEQAPESSAKVDVAQQSGGEDVSENEVLTLILSAHQEKRLGRQAELLAQWLSTEGRSESLASIARTLSQRRAIHDYRASFVVSSHEEAIEALSNFANGRSVQWSINDRVFHKNKGVVWVFSGHGAQWVNMGKELLSNSVFHSAIAALNPTVEQEMGFSCLEALQTGDFERSDKIQVLTYVMQIGLAALLKSKGVQSQAIIGHSVGEIAAAVVAGCLTPDEGAIIVSRRARLYRQVSGTGGMALVSLPFDHVVAELGDRKDVVAAIDPSPSTCVISGETAALEEYTEQLKQRGARTWKVQTDIAFHSPMLDALIAPLQSALENSLNPRPTSVLLFSTAHANPRTEVVRDADYWTHNMIAPVRLLDAVNAATEDGYRIFMEISTHPIVTHSISETLQATVDDESAAFGTMKRDAPAERNTMLAISNLFTLGADVDFRKQLGPAPWSTKVPNTPWFHKPYWKTISEYSTSSIQSHDVDQHTLLGGKTAIAGTQMTVWSTTLDESTKPYPLTHPLDGTEIIPAAVYCTTFQKATGATVIDNLELKVPVSMGPEQRNVQVVVDGENVRLLSCLGNVPGEQTWIEHSVAKARVSSMAPYHHKFSLPELRRRNVDQLPTEFAWTYLQRIGVSGIAFPWAVLEHYGNEQEMLVKMDMDPSSDSLSWDQSSWAPFLDAATSVGSSIFFNSIRLRIVSGIDQVIFVRDDAPPKIGWLFIENTTQGERRRAEISILSEDGVLLAKLKGMRFSDVEVTNDRSMGTEALVHRLAWIPPAFAESPLPMSCAILISTDAQLTSKYTATLQAIDVHTVAVLSSQELNSEPVKATLERPDTVAIYIPESTNDAGLVSAAAHAHAWETASILNKLTNITPHTKLFVVSHHANKATTLAHAPLHGLARVAASEYLTSWGGLIECENDEVPLIALRYVRDQSVIRIQDGLPRVLRMRPFAKSQQHQDTTQSLLPKPQGTYLVTGGFGDLGLEVIDFLTKKGARRIVVVSRRSLPPRKTWGQAEGNIATIIAKLQGWEALGVTIHAIPLDIGSPLASEELSVYLERLNLPAISGVVHAAGISVDGFIRDTTAEMFANVMASKVQGALNLHKLFAPGSLGFFVFFSSIGHVLGTPGQAAYASANAFLDTLAAQRRMEGCNSIAIQWTAWRNMGLAKDNDILEMELSSQGVTDITTEEAFEAWENLSKYSTDHAVVTRTRILDHHEPLPTPLITDIVQRGPRPTTPTSPTSTVSTASSPASPQTPQTPLSGPELKLHLGSEIRQCLSTVLHLDVEDIDDRAAFTDFGVDSVVTVTLRQQLQKKLGVKVPPTLMWNYPTVGHLAGWFYEKMAE